MGRDRWLAAATCAAWLLAAVDVARAAEAVSVTFGGVLSNANGPVPFGEARVVVDPGRGEVFVLESQRVHVFNEFGMEVYAFQTGPEFGPLRDLVVLPDGKMLILSYDPEAPADQPRFVILKTDFRGRVIGVLEPSGIPAEFAAFRPNRLVLQGSRLLLASTHELLVVAIKLGGEFERGFDLGRILGVPDEDRSAVELFGLSVDPANGNLLVTAAVLFRAFVISPEGKLVGSWGNPGTTAGTFGNIAGIASDGKGRYFVLDRVRRIAMVFAEDFSLVTEFGADGTAGPVLGHPSAIVTDGRGRVYVTQVGQAGVWVYDVRAD